MQLQRGRDEVEQEGGMKRSGKKNRDRERERGGKKREGWEGNKETGRTEGLEQGQEQGEEKRRGREGRSVCVVESQFCGRL